MTLCVSPAGAGQSLRAMASKVVWGNNVKLVVLIMQVHS